MSTRIKNMREVLLMAGISEINAHGVTGFSIRRVAASCNVSCAAPYKHFVDKEDFIANIVDYVNGQWHARQAEILDSCGDDVRQQLIEMCCGYLDFLVDNPYFRSILLLKDEKYDNIYHRPRGEMSSRTQKLEQELYATKIFTPEVFRRKLHTLRALMFGTMFMLHTGEITYTDEVRNNFRYCVSREFDIP